MSEADRFEVGEIVQLKSGGPKMTIEGQADAMVSCTWFDGGKQVRSRFVAKTLKKSEE